MNSREMGGTICEKALRVIKSKLRGEKSDMIMSSDDKNPVFVVP